MAALFHTLEAAAQDDAAELAEALITDLVKDAEAADKKARLRSLRDLDDAAILLRDMAKLIFEENALPLDQWREALFERLPRDDLVAAMAEVDANRQAPRRKALCGTSRTMAQGAPVVLQHRHQAGNGCRTWRQGRAGSDPLPRENCRLVPCQNARCANNGDPESLAAARAGRGRTRG
nr:hypothetical protein [uncultured Rhodopila sp.]